MRVHVSLFWWTLTIYKWEVYLTNRVTDWCLTHIKDATHSEGSEKWCKSESSVLQCVAVCCSVLQCVESSIKWSKSESSVALSGVRVSVALEQSSLLLYSTLQHTATHCNTLQHTATDTHVADVALEQSSLLLCNTPQHTTTHCNTLQHTATNTHVADVALEQSSLPPYCTLRSVALTRRGTVYLKKLPPWSLSRHFPPTFYLTTLLFHELHLHVFHKLYPRQSTGLPMMCMDETIAMHETHPLKY